MATVGMSTTHNCSGHSAEITIHCAATSDAVCASARRRRWRWGFAARQGLPARPRGMCAECLVV
jgi:hypothetical protein